MITNALKDKCTLYLKVSTLSAKGEAVDWGDPVASYWCRKIHLSVTTQNAYQQLKTLVTDRFTIEGHITIGLGTHKIVHDSTTYEPQVSARYYDDITEVIVREM